MQTETLARRFARIGARISTNTDTWLGMPSIDIGTDRGGERFEFTFANDAEPTDLVVVDVDPADRHLLLLARSGERKSKFLCGHDERHWFVAAVPEAARGVTGVQAAKQALQPAIVQWAVRNARPKDPYKRRNVAYVRQGEWFFVPVEGFSPGHVLRNEPLTRGAGSKPHTLEFAARRGGQQWMVSPRVRRGMSVAQYVKLSDDQRFKLGPWERRVRDPELYARGAVRHADHATITLRGWHRVVMNTEHEALAMRHVAFLD